MSDRNEIIAKFLNDAGWSGAERRPLAGDASFRRYDRITRGGDVAVLMDAPPPQEDVRPFVRITRHLQGLGYSVPTILAEDPALGLLLLEDLGDATYTRALAAKADEAELYEAAVDLIADLHNKPARLTIPEALPEYDAARLVAEAELLVDWYMPAQLGRPVGDAAKRTFREIWAALVPAMTGKERTIVLRDFHADNLIWLPRREPIRNCALLDYQDAVAGSSAYDLMSLIEDARRDMDPDLEIDLIERYHDARPDMDWDAFRDSYVTLAAQRHCKVIGIFTRLCVRDGKPIYLGHIPRVWRMLERACDDPLLAPLRDWLDQHMPKKKRGVPTVQKPKAEKV
jgi:aminoglycoside/choline kinase family phosphotransferase